MAGGHFGSWEALIFLGAFHGINPAMGWLFAVALGLQERRRGAVWRALLPLGMGHALAIAGAIVIAIVLGVVVPQHVFRWIVAAFLVALGLRFFFHHPHPRWAAMRVSMADLTLWSFLVASVHGAGLMVVPVFLGMQDSTAHVHSMPNTAGVAILATAVHAAAYLLVAGPIAFLVFEKFGVGLLRKAWINLDFIWACALVVTGVANLLM